MHIINLKHLLLYVIAIILFIFGNSSFLEKIKKEKEENKKSLKIKAEVAEISSRKFEVQPLTFDSIDNRWKNESIYFQTVHLGKVDFKSTPTVNKTIIETNDDENASESA